MGLRQRLRALLKDNRNGDEILQADLAKNPFYPFQLGLTYEDRARVFTLRVPYRERFVGEVVCALSGLLIFILLTTKSHADSVIFVYCNLIFFQSLAVWINYRHERIYILDEGTKTYSFVVGNRSGTGAYHNVYIRLSKEKQMRNLASSPSFPKYHLVLDGVKIDRQQLTRKSSPDIRMMRKLGHKLAKNLNINYFDEANVSVFHNVRHWPVNRR